MRDSDVSLIELQTVRVVNVDKTILGQPQTNFNRHRIGQNSMLLLESFVESLVNMPAPSNVKELQRFISTIAYYSKFMPHFATVAELLSLLLK